MAPLRARLRIKLLSLVSLVLLLFAVTTLSLPVVGFQDATSQLQALTGQAAKIPWSGWWWPFRDDMKPNLYDRGGPLDKYDQYVLASRGYNPNAKRWEEKAHGSILMIYSFEVERDGLRGEVSLKKYGAPIDEETIEALNLLRELIRGVTPQDRIEEEIKKLEETLWLGGFWWEGFRRFPSLRDLLANIWTIREEGWEEKGEVASWLGQCDGLAAASTMEDEPRHYRTLYGINFTVADLKGLLTVAWQHSYYERQVWDATPKNFHEKLQEIIGIQRRPLIMDLARGEVVSNHSAYRYEITPIGGDGDTVNFQAKVWFADYASADFIGTKTFIRSYEYSLALDPQGGIANDGKWISASHPDFIWLPRSPRPSNPKVDIDIVREINADLVITLYWDEDVDLNLYVIGPQGIISRGNPRLGDGRLDRDVIHGGPNSSESIFWPQGKVPSGNYSVLVEYRGNCKDGRVVEFTVRIVAGEEEHTFRRSIEAGAMAEITVFKIDDLGRYIELSPVHN